MKDFDIRIALKGRLLFHYAKDPYTRILDELGLRHGAARIDIAVINGLIHGFELKSDYDTLQRLPAQVNIYNSVLDRVTLVVGQRHLKKATSLIPTWWGIKLVESGSQGVIRFIEVREAQENTYQDILAVSKLLWREEALSLLEEFGEAEGVRSKPRARIYEKLIDVVEPNQIRCRVRHQLRTRLNWRVVEQRTLSDG
jgi:hypothetical protein